MLLAYLDESYNNSHYWIVALLCNDEVVAKLGSDLDAVVNNAALKFKTEVNAELHAHDLMQGKRDWMLLGNMPRAQIGIYQDALEAIVKYPVEIVIRGVDTNRLKIRYKKPFDHYALALAHTLERVNAIAKQRDTYALTIADVLGGKEPRYREFLLKLQTDAEPGYTNQRLDRIVDTLHFVPSSSSRFIQAADLILYIYMRNRSLLQRQRKTIAAEERLLSLVTPKISRDSGLWTP